jgi:hypothetical protein
MIHFLAARIARRSVALADFSVSECVIHCCRLTAIVCRLNLITQCNASNAAQAEHARDGVKKLQIASKLFAIVRVKSALGY